MFAEVVLLLGLVLPFLLVLYTKHAYSYWQRRNVPFVAPNFPFGNMSNTFARKHPMFVDIHRLYKTLKPQGHSYAGIFFYVTPRILALDPEVAKDIMSKDFHYFTDRGIYSNERDDPLSVNLLTLCGDRWRQMRAKLTPTFTSGKIKIMFKTLNDCSAPLIHEMSTNNQAVDIRELIARFTTDVIGSCAFGVECNSFSDPDAEFRKYGKRAFEMDALGQLKMLVMICTPGLAKWLRLVQTKPEVSSFVLEMVRKTVKFREENDCARPDFLQLLIELKKGDEGLSIDELAAQAYIFFLAGFETSSTTMTFCFYELARQQEIQDRLREEIVGVLRKHGGEITYEAIKEMKYLSQVIDETLRRYPPLPLLVRLCTQRYQFPGSDLVIDKGMKVIIPVHSLHHDPEYYPEPETFDPDRFSEENRAKIPPYTYLPFGEGPRNCIGLRFGLLQAQIGLVAVLKHFRLRLSERTPDPITMDSKTFMTKNLETIFLDCERIA